MCAAAISPRVAPLAAGHHARARNLAQLGLERAPGQARANVRPCALEFRALVRGAAASLLDRDFTPLDMRGAPDGESGNRRDAAQQPIGGAVGVACGTQCRVRRRSSLRSRGVAGGGLAAGSFAVGGSLESGSEALERECGIRAASNEGDLFAVANSQSHDARDAARVCRSAMCEDRDLRGERFDGVREERGRARMQSMSQPHGQRAP